MTLGCFLGKDKKQARIPGRLPYSRKSSGVTVSISQAQRRLFWSLVRLRRVMVSVPFMLTKLIIFLNL